MIIHVGDGFRHADVAGMWHDLAAMLVHQFTCGVFADLSTPSADMHFRAKLQETFGHFLAESRAAACYQNAFPGHQAVAKH